jgi:hypothetical protein
MAPRIHPKCLGEVDQAPRHARVFHNRARQHKKGYGEEVVAGQIGKELLRDDEKVHSAKPECEGTS